MRWPGHRFALGIFATILIAWMLAMAIAIRDAALPPEAAGPLLVVFEPGLSETDTVERIARAGGSPVRQTWLSAVWVVAGEEPGLAGRLEREGALGAYGELPVGPQLAGCFAWADTKVVELFDLRP